MDTLIDGNETNKEEKERKTTFANTITDLLSLPAMMASGEPPDTSDRVQSDEAIRSKRKPAIGRRADRKPAGIQDCGEL